MEVRRRQSLPWLRRGKRCRWASVRCPLSPTSSPARITRSLNCWRCWFSENSFARTIAASRRSSGNGRTAGSAGVGQGSRSFDALARRAKAPGKRGFEELPAACCNHGRTCGLIVDDEDCTAAIDSTGLETRHASMHFQRRCGRTEATHAAWPKLTAVFHANSQLIVGAVAARGPSQDSPDFPAAVRQAAANLRPRRLLGDKGCDAEHNHALRRQDSAFAARSSRSIRETLSGRPRGAIAG